MVFLMIEQPSTCPYCGSRSKIISDLSHTNSETQIHKCLDNNCHAIFVEVDDFEFLQELS